MAKIGLEGNRAARKLTDAGDVGAIQDQPAADEVNEVANARLADGAEFTASVSKAGLNPAVTPAMQRAALKDALNMMHTLANKEPPEIGVFMVDYYLTGLNHQRFLQGEVSRVADGLAAQGYDMAPILKARATTDEVGARHLGYTPNQIRQLPRNPQGQIELTGVPAALVNGALLSVPGYTEEASDDWRATHAKLWKSDPKFAGLARAMQDGRFGQPGSRFPLNIFGHIQDANAQLGFPELLAEIKKATYNEKLGRSLGMLVFAGQGADGADRVFARPIDEGGADLHVGPNVAFKFGRAGNGFPTEDAENRLRGPGGLFDTWNRTHPGPVVQDAMYDADEKMGWVQLIESQTIDGLKVTVAAYADDRRHNLLGGQAGGRLGKGLVDIKSVPPGESFSQIGNQERQISTFDPNVK